MEKYLNSEQYYEGKMNIERLEKFMEDIKKKNKNKEVYEEVSKEYRLEINE